jgi:salicylate hydroxylase
VLGVLMSRLRTWEQLPQLMEAFQDLRQGRCNHVHLSELNNAALVTLPPGEHRDMRDAGMRLSLITGREHWDDGQLREQWEEISDVFGYNAREAAEDWWIKWGSLGEHNKAVPVHEPLDLRFEVTEVASSTWMTETR